MDITKPSYRPEAETQFPLAQKRPGQVATRCRVKKAKVRKPIVHQDRVNPKPRNLSSKDRTVIEFSKFCANFYSKAKSSTFILSNEISYKHSPNEVSDFCKFIRLTSHNHKRLFDELTDIISIKSDDEHITRNTLRKLVHSEEYQDIEGIEEARNALPARERKAAPEEDSETGFLPCRRSARILSHKSWKDALVEKTSPYRSKDELSSEEETSPPPITRRKATHI